MDTKLPTVICCHGFHSSYRSCKTSVGLSLAKSGFAGKAITPATLARLNAALNKIPKNS